MKDRVVSFFDGRGRGGRRGVGEGGRDERRRRFFVASSLAFLFASASQSVNLGVCCSGAYVLAGRPELEHDYQII